MITKKPPKMTFFFLTLLILIFHHSHAATSPSPTSYTKLVFKGCADQKFQDPNGVLAQNLKALYSSLQSQSTQKPFFSSSTEGSSETAIKGLYQCRGDLSTTQCSDCVSKIPSLASNLCPNAIAARVQLHGCYLKYEVSELYKGVSSSSTQLLYRVCGSIRAKGSGFGERRDKAFGMVLEGLKSGELFYASSFESLYVLGQCEGDLSSDSDCGNCVKSAVERVESDCGSSISGQVYLDKCYVSYSYYPNGVPGISTSSSSGDGSDNKGRESGQNHTQKTVAIVVGGVAAFGFLVACLMFLRSVVKKHSRNNKY